MEISPQEHAISPIAGHTVQFLPVQTIDVPATRQRQEFDPPALLELANSISSKGLLHALTVHDSESGRPTLVAGERRLRAIRNHLIPLGRPFTYGGELVPVGHVPVVKVVTDDPLILEEIEWEENAQRKDLTWQEKAQATARLNEIKSKRAAQKGESWSTADLATTLAPQKVAEYRAEGRSLGSLQDSPRKEVIVARHLDDPDVAKAKTLDDAFKVLKKKEEARRVEALGLAVGKISVYEFHAVHNANCVTWMEGYIEMGGPAFDVICTDPPYGMGAHEFGDAAGRLATIDHSYDDSYDAWVKLIAGAPALFDFATQAYTGAQTGWCELAYKICKPQAHAYVFCDFDRFHELKGFMEAAGWYVFRTPLINYKVNSGRVPLPDLGPRRQYEIILYAIKGKKPTTAIYSDVITSEADEQLSHGAQKPVALYLNLLRRSVRPGDLVLDTFGGTGTLLPAAHELRCRATVIEQNPVYYGLCVERLKGLDA